MFDQLALPDEDMPEVDLSEQRVALLVGDIRRNSRNRRIAMVSVFVLAAAVVSAMLAAPPQHGGLALTADAESPDPALPRVFGSNGVWSVAEPIEDVPAGDPGPADMIQAPTEPTAPEFTLSPPATEDLHSLPASTSTPPTSTSGQSQEASSPADLDWSLFPVIRIEAEPADAIAESAVDTAADSLSSPDPSASAEDIATPETATPDTSANEDVTVAVEPQTEQTDSQTEANPSTPTDDSADSGATVFSAPAAIQPQSVLVYSAHVSVTVQVVDDDSSVIDWCSTRVDWGDGSITRGAGADDAALCTATCEYESTSSNAGGISPEVTTSINEIISFEHVYTARIDASPRIFVATGDGCSYTLAELQLPPFNVDPLS